MTTITIFPHMSVAYDVDEHGVKTIAHIMEDYSSVLKVPSGNATGMTGADIGWNAYKEAVVTTDYRQDDR